MLGGGRKYQVGCCVWLIVPPLSVLGGETMSGRLLWMAHSNITQCARRGQTMSGRLLWMAHSNITQCARRGQTMSGRMLWMAHNTITQCSRRGRHCQVGCCGWFIVPSLSVFGGGRQCQVGCGGWLIVPSQDFVSVLPGQLQFKCSEWGENIR